MLSSMIRRMFSTIVHEIGAEINTSSLKLKESQEFFKLERLQNFEEVLKAPEGTPIVIKDGAMPTKFEQSRLLNLLFIYVFLIYCYF